MKITLFTANQSRHNYLINKLSEISDELFVAKKMILDFQALLQVIILRQKFMKTILKMFKQKKIIRRKLYQL